NLSLVSDLLAIHYPMESSSQGLLAMTERVAIARILLVSRTRCSVLTLLRRAGTQKATAIAAMWAPALQRTAEVALRCVRGTRPSLRRALPQHCHREFRTGR
ncbi:hypothetical protein XH97_16880, partial [Bradyrhizobium sp. CCBAU 53380]|nr:hypothetical protein [Bradyrhizobium sp. CCBAU 53380]